MFRYGVLRDALARPGALAATDEAQAVEALAATGACALPRLVAGSALNVKVTYPADLALAAAILAVQEGSRMNMRIGNGFDVHALVAGRRLVLGGVTIPHERGLDGHSDADVLLHAICDAILGRAGAGRPRRALSRHRSALEGRRQPRAAAARRGARRAARGWRVGNVDATVIAQAPKLAPHVPAMRANIAADLGCAAWTRSASRRRRPSAWASPGAARASRRWRRCCSMRP